MTPTNSAASNRIASRRMARRLLAGSGSAAVTAYRLDPRSAGMLVLHALDSQGRVLVAACPSPTKPILTGSDDIVRGGSAPGGAHGAAGGAGGSDDEGGPHDVRLDVTLEAAEAQVRVTTASAHLLGRLTWLDRSQRAAVLAGAERAACYCPVTGEDPLDALLELANRPGGRFGVITFDKVMVHDAHGVSGHTVAELLCADGEASALLWSADAEVEAQERVSALGEVCLGLACQGVVEGWVPGIVCSRRPPTSLCSSLTGRVLCVDASPYAVTLMQLDKRETFTVQVLLPSGASTPAAAGEYISDVVRENVLEHLVDAVPLG